jgi:predicted metal-dependent phosphotriesterase family hydrolase
MVTVRTVLDLPATDLGPTNHHEHLFATKETHG